VQLSDITVEVRDKNLTRLGLIRHEELDLELSDLHNNIGSWKLRLAVEHPLAVALRQPGSGIVVTGRDGDEVFSGPTIKQENAATADDPAGTITFEGVTDTILLADYVALPDPTNPDLDSQTKAHDIRTGPAETLMHAFVNANIGPAAPAARRPAGLLASKLVMGSNLARGAAITKSARFPVLGNLLSELAGPDNLGFRIIQRGNTLRFETYQVVDRSTEVRLDVYNSTLAGHRVAITPPGATRVLVAGQGDLTERQFFEMETAESVAAEAEWGRRIERFVDQRNTDDEAELQRAGKEVLDEEGFATLAVQAVPMEDSAMEFGIDWYLGDRVGVVVEHQELASTVTGYVLKASKDGFRLGALIGDPVGFDPSAALSKRVGSAENRISALERNAENNAAGVKYLDVADFDQDTLPEQYPQGESLIYVTDAWNQGWSAFGFASGSVRSVHVDGQGRVSQQFQTQSGVFTEPKLYVRSGVKDFGWTDWRLLATEKKVTDEIALVNARFKQEDLSRTGALTAGTWYRIATLTGVQGQTPGAKATGLFIIRTDASGQHAYIRLRVGYAFNDREGTTMYLEEYTGYAGTTWKQPFSQARLVPIGGTSGTYDGAHLEVLCTGTPADFKVDMTVEHDDWAGGKRWTPVNFTAQGTTDNDWRTVGMFWTGRWTPVTLRTGWSNYGTGYPFAEFMMLPGSLVKVRGMVASASSVGGDIGYIPEGARSRYRLLFPALGGGNSLARVDVTNTGALNYQTGTQSFITLETITYVAEW
jgi:hypothetical protein